MPQKKPYVLRRFFPYMGRKKKLIPLALVFSALAAVLSAIPFVFIWLIVRETLLSSQGFALQQVAPYAWGMGLCAVSGVVFYFLALTFSHLAAFRVEMGLQKVSMERLMSMPLGFFSSTDSGKIRKIVNDSAATTHGFLAHQLPDLAGSILTPLVLFIMILAVNWKMGLVALIPALLGGAGFATMMTKEGKRFMQRYFDALEEMSNEAVEYVRGVPVVKTFGQTVFSFTRFYQSIIKYKEYVLQYTLLWRQRMSFTTVALQSTAFFLLPITLLFFFNGSDLRLVLTDFIFYLVIAPNFIAILTRSGYFRQNAYIAEQALDRIDALFAYPQPEYSTETEQEISSYTLEFRNVSFQYEGAETNAVDDVSFTVGQGETVALVGPSGGGKTTLARLAARFWDVQQGQILIGGIDVTAFSRKQLMETVSFVFQNTRLFSTSLRENIRVGKEDASQKELQKAVELSRSQEIIDRLPDGIDTILGTEGTYLSGGEQQRISLARALLKNAPVVLLDEATAFADPENEQQIMQALQELGRGKTTLLIAHRLTSVEQADKILVVGEGKIVEQGSHDELLAKQGLYARMYAEYQESIAWKLQAATRKRRRQHENRQMRHNTLFPAEIRVK
ncbi:MAG: ABC transporter ATP-binding protein [Spirochaetales bacterium]|nr:MAG: ABC transporter ATP-binding protein [Spirochaetales bacterium]